MWIASLFPGVVGVVRWRASEPMLTVVVKSTYDLGSGRARTRPEQLGLCRDHRLGWEAEGEVHYASDFAPHKPRAGLLVVGHARAERPARVMDVHVQVGRFSKRATALTPVPATEVRLSSVNLRAEQLRPRLRRDPSSTSCPRSKICFRTAIMHASTWPPPISSSADRGRSAVVVLHSRELIDSVAASLPPHLRAMLERLEKSAPGSTASVDPSAAEAAPLPFKPAAEGTPSAPPPIADELTLVDEESGPETPPAGVRLGGSQLGGSALVSDKRPEAMPFEKGEPSRREVRGSSPPAPAPPAASAPNAPRTDVFDARELVPSDPLPFRSGPLPRAPGVSEDAQEQEQTRASTLEGAASSPPLPFRRGAPGERPTPAAVALAGEPAPASGRTMVGALPVSGGELPFGRAERSRESSAPPPAPSMPTPSAGVGFVPRPPNPIAQPAPPIEAPRPMETERGSEPPAKSQDGEASVSLSTYASIKVALLSGRPLAEVLEQHGLDAIAWRLEERRRSEELSRAAASGDLSVVHRLRGAMRERAPPARAGARTGAGRRLTAFEQQRIVASKRERADEDVRLAAIDGESRAVA